MAELWQLAGAAASGALVAFLLTVFGGGGSVLATPLLMAVAGVVDPHVAIGTSAAAVAVNAAGSLLVQARAGRVKWPCALVFGGAGLAGALAGAEIAKRVDGSVLLLWFAVAMAAIAISMLLPKRDAGNPDVHLTRAMTMKLAPVGAATGLAAGFFGIGGGFLIAPGLMAATGMTLANAAASSLVSVTLFGAATSVSYAASGYVNWALFGALAAGGVIGMAAGAPASRVMANHAPMARRIFAVMVLAVAAYVAWKALGTG